MNKISKQTCIPNRIYIIYIYKYYILLLLHTYVYVAQDVYMLTHQDTA
jgi:hypothetical protein